jgi:hypothetical protein
VKEGTLKETANHKYRVIVADNFHYMDESAQYTRVSSTRSRPRSLPARKIVDDDLDHSFKPGMTAQELYELYSLFGEDRAPPGEPPRRYVRCSSPPRVGGHARRFHRIPLRKR